MIQMGTTPKKLQTDPTLEATPEHEGSETTPKKKKKRRGVGSLLLHLLAMEKEELAVLF